MIEDDNVVLTTIDNPYNPKEDYDKWRQWDNEHGYYTEEYLARMIDLNNGNIVDEEDHEVINTIINKAIVEVLESDDEGIYILV